MSGKKTKKVKFSPFPFKASSECDVRVGFTVIHLATEDLLSEFSRSSLGWLTHPAAGQEYLLQIPTVRSEEPLGPGSLCISINKTHFVIAQKIHEFSPRDIFQKRRSRAKSFRGCGAHFTYFSKIHIFFFYNSGCVCDFVETVYSYFILQRLCKQTIVTLEMLHAKKSTFEDNSVFFNLTAFKA